MRFFIWRSLYMSILLADFFLASPVYAHPVGGLNFCDSCWRPSCWRIHFLRLLFTPIVLADSLYLSQSTFSSRAILLYLSHVVFLSDIKMLYLSHLDRYGMHKFPHRRVEKKDYALLRPITLWFTPRHWPTNLLVELKISKKIILRQKITPW